MLACVQLAFTAADGVDFYQVTGVKKDDVLNIRSTPSPRAKIIGIIPAEATRIENLGEQWPKWESDVAPDAKNLKGTDLTDEEKKALQTRNIWLKIKYKNVEGWARSKYLTEFLGE